MEKPRSDTDQITHPTGYKIRAFVVGDFAKLQQGTSGHSAEDDKHGDGGLGPENTTAGKEISQAHHIRNLRYVISNIPSETQKCYF